MNANVPTCTTRLSVFGWGSCALEGQSMMPFLMSPRLCNRLPKFSLLEYSGKEFFQSQLAAFELMFT